jgi:uncharacterized protein
MKRRVETRLKTWKDSPRRKPLIVRGARQVGKTFSIQRFGEAEFDHVLTVDLERNRNWHRIFDGELSPTRILAELEVVLNSKIIPGKTLLFFDEIQSCSKALMALRYFYEERPDVHLIAAGSLLEFALTEISFPVGRVQYVDMHPMDFEEYLWATGRDLAAEAIAGRPRPLPGATHDILMEELRSYCFVGGMPECVKSYAETASFHEATEVQQELRESFRNDFAKYSPRVSPECLDQLLSAVARGVGASTKYSQLTRDFSHATVKRAFDVLCKARLIKPVPSASPSGLPFAALQSPRRFKTIFLDVGLWQSLCGIQAGMEYGKENLLDVYRGAMAEQFVGQELMGTQKGDLYYWSRAARSSSAEVDYLASVDGAVVPIEVKSGVAGKLRSLHRLLKEYPNCQKGLVFSGAPYSELPEQKLIFLPLYWVRGATAAHIQEA